MNYKKIYEQTETAANNLSGLIGFWQGTAVCLQYEDDPKKIHEQLRKAYEISQEWFDMRDQVHLTREQVEESLATKTEAL